MWRIMKNLSELVSLPIAGKVSTRKFKEEDTMLQSHKSFNCQVKPRPAGERHVYKSKEANRKQTRWKM